MATEPGGEMQPIVSAVWREKYRLVRPDGGSDEASPLDSHRRVCAGVYAADPRRDQVEPLALRAMVRHEWCPGGRIHAGAGTGRRVTLINCFVNGTVEDSMVGIMAANTRAALTMQQGGGIGTDFSPLRPRGALVERTGSVASGPLSFMEIWQATCGTIMSGGSRRGAMMATLADDHPDLPEFIRAKTQGGRLTNFNLSVLVSDALLAAIEHDRVWELGFKVPPADPAAIQGVRHDRGDGPWYVYRRLPARELWDLITRTTYDTAEPGVVFIDRVNQWNNLSYCEDIRSTNPCVTAESWVHTSEGPRQVADLVGRPFAALVDGRAHASGPSGFFATGLKPVLRLVTREGYSLRLTADHPVRSATGEWVAAGQLRPGDSIALGNHRGAADWPGQGNWDEGYLIGLLLGDGTLKSDKTVLSVWPGPSGDSGVMRRAEAAIRQMPHRADFAGWMEVRGRGEWRMTTAALRNLAGQLGIAPGAKGLTPAVERMSAAFQRGVLAGLFDSDGSVQGTQAKGVSVRLAQSNLEFLRAAQRMLLRLGIASSLYADRRPSQPRSLPDGKGGYRLYFCAAQHELVIAGDNIGVFAERVGFCDEVKAARLSQALADYQRRPNRERFVAEVESMTDDGEAEVFDVAVPGVNAFDANGLVVHNCGEQPLPPHGACNLGCVNLAALVRDPFGPQAAFDYDRLAQVAALGVRFLDNVLDVTPYPQPEQQAEAHAKRRIGLGVMGLANALQMLGLRYGGPEAEAAAGAMMAALRDAACQESVALAAERGPFPLFDRDRFLAAPFVQTLPQAIRDGIAAGGIRNGVLLTIAPTGTTSIYYDNVSSGLEPTFGWRYFRKIVQPDGSRMDFPVIDAGFAAWCRVHGLDPATAPLDQLPPAMVTAHDLTVADHVRMQAVCQRHVDASISKTINCPPDISYQDFQAVYRLAWELGCKGCTTYRPSGLRGAVLSTGTETAEAYPAHRPEELDGKTYKLRWPLSDDNLYVTINDITDSHGRRRPFEIFIASRSAEHAELLAALTITLSAVMRRAPNPAFLVEDLERVRGAQGAWVNGKWMNGLVALIASVMRRHCQALGLMAIDDGAAVTEPLPAETRPAPGAICRRCNSPTLYRVEGCEKCASCGWSSCQ